MAIYECADFVKIALCCLALSGCATEPKRYLTPEADRRMQELCEERGCVVIPVPAQHSEKAQV